MSAENSQTLLETLPRDRNTAFDVPTTVMDELTYQLVQMPDLYKVMNTATTYSGQLTLYRSLRQPPTSVELTRAKQDAVRELGSDDKLRSKVEEYLQDATANEGHLYTHFFGDYQVPMPGNHPNLYDTYKGTREFLKFLTKDAKGIEAKSEYLGTQVNNLKALANADIYDSIENPVYLTALGLRNKEKSPWYLPKMRFYPTDLKPVRYLLPAAAFPIMAAAMEFGMSPLIGKPPDMDLIIRASAGGIPMAGLMSFFLIPIGRMYDDSWYVRKVGNRYFADPNVQSAVESLGAIDELMTLVKYGERANGPVVLPEITDDSPHHFRAKGLRNPLMVIDTPDYVPNDVDLDGARLTFVTGPNSGGKTSLCKSIAQAQVLAQIGSPIPADSAEIAIADRTFYYAPMINSLQDVEGRFGTNIGRTRDLFLQTTPRSLVLLDELIEATTYEERLKHSYDILDAFWHIGNNTVLVTHNHQLAEHFKGEDRGQYWKVEFQGKTPTHKIVEGISTESHSDDVMERLGFTREDMFKHLKEAGYIQ